MEYLPIFVQIKNRPCLVVGGGSIAARKVALLRKAQAEVTIVSPELCDELQQLCSDGLVQHTAREFEDFDLETCVLVIAATDQRAVNERVSALAHQLRLPVNVVDNPDLCSFIMPSIIDRSPVVIAVSTGGSSPVLARLIRTKLFLVGAGPGDPDLLTFRALRLMQQAEVVVYDRLVSPSIMEMVRRDAEIVYVGKERDKHTMQQENINQLLVRLAKEGKRVLRLKGGDPFIFGRGGEEIELLAPCFTSKRW
jgi:hypothetical protein